MKKLKYSEIRPGLKTGDLVLFSGNSPVSRLIRLGTRSRWSHVGMVIEGPAGIYLWESTTLSSAVDMQTGKATRGVQTCYLSDRLASYEGDVGIRVLKNKIEPGRLEELAAFRERVRGRPYEQNCWELLAAAVDVIDIKQGQDLSSLFCSELVAEALQACGMLRSDMPSNEFTPADFARPEIPCDGAGFWEREVYEVEYDNYQRVSA